MSANPEMGRLLVAEPFMIDPHFKRSVVVLCEHNDDGAVGFIINRTMKVKINELVEDFPEINAPLYYGGPVQTDSLHYIHNVGEMLEDSLQISRNTWWGGDFEKLKFLIQSKLVRPENIRFYIGYSGWSHDQLNDELNIGNWVTADLDPNYIFNTRPHLLWKQVMYNKGERFAVISQIPERLSWN